MGFEDTCSFCDIMLAVPAAIACADVGDVDDSHRYLAVAERSSRLWRAPPGKARSSKPEPTLPYPRATRTRPRHCSTGPPSSSPKPANPSTPPAATLAWRRRQPDLHEHTRVRHHAVGLLGVRSHTSKNESRS